MDPTILEAVKQAIIEDIVQIAITGGSLVIAVGSGLWSFFTAKRLKKQEYELQKNLDRVNSLNERLTHVNNNRFDYEFEVYKNLSESSFHLIHGIGEYIAAIFWYNNIEKEPDLYQPMLDGVYSYRDVVLKYAAFIPEPLYNVFNDFLLQGIALSNILVDNRGLELRGYSRDVNTRYFALQEKHKELISELRNYLEKISKEDSHV